MTTFLKSLKLDNEPKRYLITVNDTNGNLWFLWAHSNHPHDRVHFNPAILYDEYSPTSDLTDKFKMSLNAYERVKELLKDDWLWNQALEDYEEGNGLTLLVKETMKEYMIGLYLEPINTTRE